MALFKVSGKSSASSIAGALVPALRRDGSVELQSVGAAALNQAIKATIIARGFLAPEGEDLVCVPSFMEIEIDGEARTALKILVVLHKRSN